MKLPSVTTFSPCFTPRYDLHVGEHAWLKPTITIGYLDPDFHRA
jgi:hypothetical protein